MSSKALIMELLQGIVSVTASLCFFPLRIEKSVNGLHLGLVVWYSIVLIFLSLFQYLRLNWIHFRRCWYSFQIALVFNPVLHNKFLQLLITLGVWSITHSSHYVQVTSWTLIELLIQVLRRTSYSIQELILLWRFLSSLKVEILILFGYQISLDRHLV